MKLKAIVSSDWHIHPWFAFSVISKFGVPSRLTDYITLAHHVVDIGKKNDCNCFISAGDWLQFYAPKPMAVNVAKECLRILSAGFERCIFIDGNHDCDQKTGDYDVFHSGLRPLMDDSFGIDYISTPQVIDVFGTSICVLPWNAGMPDYSAMPAADLFIGHGLVSGATDPHGHEFKNGFSADELCDRFKLSIVGDIHKGQVISSSRNDNLVLIPGQPIQNNFASDENCGVWVVGADTGYRPSFISITNDSNIADNKYHRFFKVETEKQSTDYVHYSHKPKKQEKQSKITPAASVSFADLAAIIKNEFSATKPKDSSLGFKIIDQCLDGYQPSIEKAVLASDSSIKSLEIKEFLSIENLSIPDFKSLEGELLVYGINGAGKTSFLEAIFWAITGETTKPILVENITRLNASQPASVTIVLEVMGVEYEIKRTRNSDCLLNLSRSGVSINKGSSVQTQQLIYQILGIKDHKDILSLCYFSVLSFNNFTDMKDSSKYEVYDKLIDAGHFDFFKEKVLSLHSDISLSRGSSEAKLSVLEPLLYGDKKSLEALLNEEAEEKVEETVDLGRKFIDKYKCSTLPEVVSVIENRIKSLRLELDGGIDLRHSSLLGERSSLNNSITSTDKEIRDLNSKVDTNKANYKTLISGKCYVCGAADASSQTKANKILEDIRSWVAQNNALVAKLAALKDDKSENQIQIDKCELVLQKDQQTLEEIEKLTEELSLVNSHIVESLKSDVKTDNSAIIAHLEEKISNCEKEIKQIEQSLEDGKSEFEILQLFKTKMCSSNSPVRAKMYASALSAIIARVNQLVDPNLMVVKEKAGKSPSLLISYRKGVFTPVDAISSGEKRILDVILLLALNSLLYEKYSIKGGFLGFAAYDELMTYLDEEFLEAAYQAVLEVDCRCKIVITHNNLLQAYFDRSIKVVKEKGSSQYQFNNIN